MKDFNLITKNDLFDLTFRIEVSETLSYIRLNKTNKNVYMRDQQTYMELSEEQLTELTEFLIVWAQRKDSGK